MTGPGRPSDSPLLEQQQESLGACCWTLQTILFGIDKCCWALLPTRPLTSTPYHTPPPPQALHPCTVTPIVPPPPS